MAEFLERVEYLEVSDLTPEYAESKPQHPQQPQHPQHPQPGVEQASFMARPLAGRPDLAPMQSGHRDRQATAATAATVLKPDVKMSVPSRDMDVPKSVTKPAAVTRAQALYEPARESTAHAEACAQAGSAAELDEELDMDMLQALPGSRLEFAQRLAEKRKELERWQQALQEKSQRLEEMERTLFQRRSTAKPSPFQSSGTKHAEPASTASWPLGTEFADGARASMFAVKALARAGLAASRLAIAVAKPVLGGLVTAGHTTMHHVAGYVQSALARAAIDAQERELAHATSIRRSKYYNTNITAASPRIDGSGVPPARYGRPWDSPAQPNLWSHGSMMSPGWQPSPIFPVSPAPSMHSVPLQPVYERESILGWIRRSSGCGSRHRPTYAYQPWAYSVR